VDPAVRVQHVLWNVLSVNTVDWVAHILPIMYGGVALA
jgi:hypothetical protein